MAADLLKASEAARRLGIPTKEVLRLIHERKIRYVMVKGIAHVPDDAVEEFPRQSLVIWTRTRRDPGTLPAPDGRYSGRRKRPMASAAATCIDSRTWL